MADAVPKDSTTPKDTPTRPKEIGRVDLKDKPLKFNVKEAQEAFPESKYLKRTDGSEYITDKNGKTILLFEKPDVNGFTSVYSPLSSADLQRQIAALPEEQRQQLSGLLNLVGTNEAAELPPAATKRRPARGSASPKAVDTSRVPDSRPEDLPVDHFIEKTREEYEEIRREQWEEVKNLDDNDPRKIVYLRRFTSEFRSTVPFNPELTREGENPYKYYVVDTSRMSELPKVEPYKTTLDVPKGAKVGIVIGYHHLEKPWGHILMKMIKEQTTSEAGSIEFIVVRNKDKPTGEESPASEAEIQQAVEKRGITHVIDAHEQLATGNHFMDSDFPPKFNKGNKSNASGGETTLDPFVPTWMIEQYYAGHLYPQLQYGVNEQIKKIESLVKEIKTN